MIEIKPPEKDWREEREPFFTIEDEDGDKREYTIPVEVPASVTLQAMEHFRQGGDAVAIPWLLELMLGSDGYRALLAAPGITRTNLAAINEVVRIKVFGDPEDQTSEPGKS